MRRIRASDITCIESESGIIATLFRHPDFAYYSEDLLPQYFSDPCNRYMYLAISILTRKDIMCIDAFNILEALNSDESTRSYPSALTVESINEFVDASAGITRDTLEEYKLLVSNVVDAAFRRDMFDMLRDCQKMCSDMGMKDVEQKIYSSIDNVMMDFASTSEVPQFKDVIDEIWEEIVSRQGQDVSGIPFKFPELNKYATIEPGELFIFAAEAKQGKSMMLLNEAVDLMKKDLSVLYLDSELNTRMFTTRLIAHLTGLAFSKIKNGSYSESESQQIDEVREWLKTRKFTHLYIPMFDMQTIYTAVKKVKHTQGLDVLIVDYFKSSGNGDAFDSYQELGRFVDCVKNKICGDMGIAGIGAAQLNSAGKVADSAKIGRNASTIAIITDKTPDEIAMDGAECGNKKLRVILNRNGAQMAEDEYIDLNFQGNLVSYEQAKQHASVTPF